MPLGRPVCLSMRRFFFMNKILVIGGGPAGMMAAIAAAGSQTHVRLFEKNAEPGRKLLLTGKGRCNVTNMASLEEFLTRFPRNGNFLRDAFKVFFNHDLASFFEERGLGIKEERQKRAFPVTDKAQSVLDVLKNELYQKKIQMTFNVAVARILIANSSVTGILLANGQKILADKVILATGGCSYPLTGSTGQGLAMAETLGHTLIPARPALVPLETRQTFVKTLMGLTLKNIRLRFIRGKKKLSSDVGELLFTDFGISGPLVLSMSGQVADMLLGGKVYAEIDLKPGLDAPTLTARLEREFRDNPRILLKNIMKKFFPAKFGWVFIQQLKIDPDKKVSQVLPAELKAMCAAMKAFRLDIAQTRPLRYAMVTQGGVKAKEINPRTMASRLIQGLYFAGEIIDFHADTGGFNLQAAFSTGFLAGRSAGLD